MFDDVNLKERFKVRVFLTIIDSLIATLNERLKAYQMVFIRHISCFLGRLQEMTSDEVVTAAE